MANTYRRGFFVQEDYWLAVRGCSRKVQGEVMGALARLYFEGEDSADSLKGTSQSLYYALRERVSLARTKAAARNGGETCTCEGDQKGDQKGDQNPVLLAKRERESKTTTCNPIQLATQPTPGQPSERALFIGKALEAFSAITARPARIPSSEIVSNLTRIFDAGYTLDDIELVCKAKQADWGSDPKRQGWIRPQTLFGGKFEAYLSEAKASPAKEASDAATRFADAI